ncbi:MAG: YitT family protein [Lachnospiraceae bacterium]|nr:YitT family protein [Lachnospiraceae bacterium]
MNKQKLIAGTKGYLTITAAVVLMDIGTYFFKFPNHFSFGGVSGLSVVLSEVQTGLSASQVNLIINMLLLVIGFAILGRDFGMKTAYVTVVSSVLLNIFEAICPMEETLTDQSMLEMIFAIMLAAASSALLFYEEASGGGTDIIAMIVKKYSTMNISTALMVVDAVIVAVSFLVFDMETGLFSICGLVAKTLFIDGALERLKLCKYVTVVCNEPEPICDYIRDALHRGATLYQAEGLYSHQHKTVILCALDRKQAVLLQRYIHRVEDTAFLIITKSSEIIGKGFYEGT